MAADSQKETLTGIAYAVGIMVTAFIAMWKFLFGSNGEKKGEPPVVELTVKEMFGAIKEDLAGLREDVKQLSSRVDADRTEFRGNLADHDKRIQGLERQLILG